MVGNLLPFEDGCFLECFCHLPRDLLFSTSWRRCGAGSVASNSRLRLTTAPSITAFYS